MVTQDRSNHSLQEANRLLSFADTNEVIRNPEFMSICNRSIHALYMCRYVVSYHNLGS